MRLIRLFLQVAILALAGSAMAQTATPTNTPTNTPTPTMTPPTSNCSYKIGQPDLANDIQHFTTTVALTAGTPVPVVGTPPNGKKWFVSRASFQGEGCSAIETRLVGTTDGKAVVTFSDGVTDAGASEVGYPIGAYSCGTADNGLSVVSTDDCTAGVVVVEAVSGK